MAIGLEINALQYVVIDGRAVTTFLKKNFAL